MAFETALIASLTAATAVSALAGYYGYRQARRAEAAELESETLRDRLWEAVERETEIRAEGERALDDAKAGAEAGDRAKSRFLATVTHEMRTPLSGVIGTAELLLETGLAADQRTYARAVKSSAEAMLTIVDEILDLSRIEADRPSLQAFPFDVAGLVEGVAELLAPRAHAKGLDLAVLIAPDAPAEIVADGARVRQILLNLTGNAIKFTTRGGVGIRVDAAPGGVAFTVEDTGPGFDPAEAESLFAEFERGAADPATSGAGLGLTISRRLADAMGGRLEAVAKAKGAAFILTMPDGGAEQLEGEGQPLAGCSVVVASNAPFTGPWLVENLKSLGARAALAPCCADKVVDVVAGLNARILIIDRPSAAQAEDLASAATLAGAERALLLLSPSERGELPRLAACGIDGYLVKPVRAASLVSRILEPMTAPEVLGETAVDGLSSVATSFPAARGGLSILVAEDDPVSALIALAHLARLGHASVHVADGAAACEAFESARFDVVLLDLRMPRLDGCGAARKMRAFEAETGREPSLILALTANVSDEDRAAAIGSGMDDLLGKPLDRRALEDLLEPLAHAHGTGARVARL